MKIHHIRNATMVLELKEHVLLIDPMLSAAGKMPSLAYFRSKPKRNPVVGLPESTHQLLDRVTHCLITHQHKDHVDQAGIQLLKEKNIPVTCSELDRKSFAKKGLNIHQTVNYWQQGPWLGGQLMGVPATHGYGFVKQLMGNVMGFLIKFPGEPSIYLSSDTVFTSDVSKVLTDYQPDISVVACGGAQLDIGQPLLMHLEDIISFISTAKGKVIANHMEAVNHCKITRTLLRAKLSANHMMEKVIIPEDGECIQC